MRPWLRDSSVLSCFCYQGTRLCNVLNWDLWVRRQFHIMLAYIWSKYSQSARPACNLRICESISSWTQTIPKCGFIELSLATRYASLHDWKLKKAFSSQAKSHGQSFKDCDLRCISISKNRPQLPCSSDKWRGCSSDKWRLAFRKLQ